MPNRPRDLVGYGRTPPKANWPGGARVAVSFVLNYEEGAERTPLNGDPVSETFLHEIMGEARTTRDYSTESIYEFGSKVGVWRVLDAFDEVQLPLTMFACGQAVELNPAPVTAAAQAGHEICSHGYRWFDYADVPEDVERDHIRRTIAAIETAAGERPYGWYTGRFSPNTRRLVAEEGGFLYDSDDYSDELPFWTRTADRDPASSIVGGPKAYDTKKDEAAMVVADDNLESKPAIVVVLDAAGTILDRMTTTVGGR